jgi:cellulose synthase/poly-beta-1,6-N-acetylglucosamine synthase-like glycosyltransferase
MENIAPWVWLIAGIFVLTLLVQLYYYLAVFSKLAFYTATPKGYGEQTGVSVIIAARNESKNLSKNLPAILEQEYPDYEVVVVNDGSWDDSIEVLEAFERQYPHLRIVDYKEQEKYPKGKKFALMLGIKAAKHEVLLFTDADCMPAGPQWLSLMVSNYLTGKQIVLGYSPFTRNSTLLNLVIRFETFTTAMLYFSMALKGKAYMGVGRNLSYTKSLFFKVKGFASHQHIMSGDDDLFVNETATATNTAIELHPDSFVRTEPKTTWGDWMRQKTRHMSTGKYYKSADKRRLGMFYGSWALFYVTLMASIIFFVNQPQLLQTIAALYGIRLLVQYIIGYMAAKRLKENSLLFFLPVLDVFFVFFFLINGTRALFVKPKVW